MVVIGLDIGTTSICGIAFDCKAGKLLKSVTRANRSGLWPGLEFAQDPDVIVRTVKAVAEELLAVYPAAYGIGLSGQMHGILYTDENGSAVSPLYTWQDRSGLEPDPDRPDLTIAEALSALSGFPLSTGFGLVTHAALAKRAALPAGAVKLCTIGDYAVMRLTNESAPKMEASNAAGIGLFDAEKGVFDANALSATGISPEWLPGIAAPGEAAGRTPAGIPVFHAIGDNQASMLGSVRDLRRTLLLNVGTGGQLSVYADRFVRADGLETRPFPGGGCLLVGASLAGGKSYAMLERFFRMTIQAFGGADAGGEPDPNVPELYGRMEALLDREYPEDGKLIVRTQFHGTRSRPEMRGAIEAIGPANFTPAHLTAGFLEGMAEELHGFYRLLPDGVRERVTAIAGSGNGLRLNRHLRRICAERFGMPLAVPPFREEASVGAALHAAVGLGAVPGGYAAAGRLIPEAP